MMEAKTGLWLGFDFGERRIGIAVGQAVTGTARPLTVLPTLQRGQPDWAAIERVLLEWRPQALIVGVPRRDDGSDYPLTPQAERFARQLAGRFGLRVECVDERLSSVEAIARYAEQTPRRADKRIIPIDAGAAAVILETWLAGEPGLRGRAHAQA